MKTALCAGSPKADTQFDVHRNLSKTAMCRSGTVLRLLYYSMQMCTLSRPSKSVWMVDRLFKNKS